MSIPASNRRTISVLATLLLALGSLPALAQPTPEQANDKMIQAVREFQQGHREEAVRLWEQALAGYRAAGDLRRQVYALENLGSAAREMNHIARALGFLSEGVDLARRGGDGKAEIGLLRKLGNAARLGDDNPRAITAFRDMLARSEAIGDRQSQAMAAGSLGRALTDGGQAQEAIPLLRRAASLFHQEGNRGDEGLAWFFLGRAQLAREDYLGATDAFEQSVAAAHETHNTNVETDALLNFGHTRYLLGDYDNATRILTDALHLAQQAGDKRTEEAALQGLGNVQYFQDRPQQAVNYYEEALNLARSTHDRAAEGEALGNLALAHTHLHQNERAAEYARQDIDIARERGDKRVLAQALGNMAALLNETGQYSSALPLIEESRDLSRSAGYRRGEAIALRNLGLMLLRTGQPASAEASLREAITIQEALREPVGKADLLNISLFESQLDSYRYLQATLVAQNRQEAALEISERGRAQALARLLVRRGQSAGPALSPDAAAIRAVARQQGATLVEFSIETADNAIYIWVVRPDGQLVFRRSTITSHGSSLDSAIAGLVKDTRESLGAPGRQPPPPKPGIAGRDEMLALFYKLLIAPIADLLPTEPEQPIVLIPQGGLFLLPFAALRDPDGHALIEQHTLIVLPSIETLGMLAARSGPARSAPAFVAGNPKMPTFRLFGSGEPTHPAPLLGAEREAVAVAKLLGTTPLLRAGATKDAVVHAIGDAGIVHLATHGFLEDARGEGMPGFVVLAPTDDKDDGLLTSSDIMALRLRARLVVLSACDTGQGRISGDGVVGLSRAFLAAGAGSVLASLWTVPDQPTSELMVSFYRALDRTNNGALALRQAMLDTRAHYSDPLAWAGFILIGPNR